MATPTDPTFARLFNDIKISIPGAIDVVIMQELWRAIEDFMGQTNVWVEEIAFDVTPDARSYVITPVGKGGIERLLMVYDPAQSGPDKRWTQQGITFQPPDKINLMYQPPTAVTWIAAVAKNIADPPLSPMQPLPDIENASWIIDRYRDAFRYCTLSYLYMQPAKPYTNPQASRINWQNYVTERGRARAEILHGNVYGGQRWMYPQGYATTARKGWT